MKIVTTSCIIGWTGHHCSVAQSTASAPGDVGGNALARHRTEMAAWPGWLTSVWSWWEEWCESSWEKNVIVHFLDMYAPSPLAKRKEQVYRAPCVSREEEPVTPARKKENTHRHRDYRPHFLPQQVHLAMTRPRAVSWLSHVGRTPAAHSTHVFLSCESRVSWRLLIWGVPCD